LLLVFASCTSGRPAPRPSPLGTAPGGTIRIAYPTEPLTLNPILPAGGAYPTRDILRPVLPALFRLDEKLRPQPELAEAYPSPKEIKRDPFTVTVRLRRARWSDGRAITSQDVRFSWEKLREGPTGLRYRFLKDVRAPSQRVVSLVFDRPYARWWSLFSLDDAVLPAHAFGDGSAWQRGAPVSGGPYRVEGWTSGLEIRLRRNERYWGRPAKAEAIDVVFVPDDENRLQLLDRGELDLAWFPSDASIGLRALNRGAKPVDSLQGTRAAAGAWGSSWWELDVNVGRPSNAVLAKAIGAALDRTLITELLDDSGQVMDGIPARFPVAAPQAHGLPAITGPWSGAGGHLDQAADILRGAGYTRTGDHLVDSRKREVSLLLAYDSDSSTAGSIARLIYFRMKDVGVGVELAGVDPERLYGDWLPNSRADMYVLTARGADAPDASSYHSDAPPARNPSRVSSADASLDAAEAGAVPEGPATGLDDSSWKRAEQALAATSAVLPLARIKSWIVSRGGVSGPQPTGTLAGPFWNAEDWRRD
jgi:ABC-type transport system substrate-binding protein